MPYDEAREFLSILGEVCDFYREVVAARETHDIFESNVERDAVDIVEFLQFLAGAQIEHGEDTSFADYRHFLLQRADVQASHGIIDFCDVCGKRIVKIYLHYVSAFQT